MDSKCFFLFSMLIRLSFVTCIARNSKESDNQQRKEEHKMCTNACNVTMNGGLVGKPWGICLKIPSNSQRFKITYSIEKQHVTCTKFNGEWIAYPNNRLRKERHIDVKCPDENDQAMCLTVFNGRKDDVGYLDFDISEKGDGKLTKLCSRYLVLRYMEYPKLITPQIDCKNRELSLISDVVETAEFNASAFYENMFLCNLHWKEECDVTGQKYSSGCLVCNVNDDAIRSVSKMYGSDTENPVTVKYAFIFGTRTTRTKVKLKIRTTLDDNDLDAGAVIGITIASIAVTFILIQLILLILLIRKHKRGVLCQSSQQNENKAVKCMYFRFVKHNKEFQDES